jgi:hypothetical protein
MKFTWTDSGTPDCVVKGIKEKSGEFTEKGSELYAKA